MHQPPLIVERPCWQRSVGADLLMGSPFATDQFGARAEIGRDGGILGFAYSAVASGAAIQEPWSGNPIYTSAMIQNFNNAGEQAALVRASYDFTRIGLPGVAAYVLYAYGSTNAAAAGPTPIKEDEVDFDLQWQVPWIKGLALRARYGYVSVDQAGVHTDLRDLRLMANYRFLLF